MVKRYSWWKTSCNTPQASQISEGSKGGMKVGGEWVYSWVAVVDSEGL